MSTATAVKHYTEGIGRRKEAVARVRISESAKPSFTINDKTLEEYFKTVTEQECSVAPLKTAGDKKVAVSVHVRGGGITAQSVAVSLGLARALSTEDKELRTPLKKAGMLTRNARIKERRKFGLKKARKSPQWSKR